MKLVKEHIIFEKFVEDSDPIHDLGIGISQIIKQAIPKIFKKDWDNLYIKHTNGKFEKLKHHSSFQFISIKENYENNGFTVKFFSNRYYNSKGKEIDKKTYAIKLFKYSNIWNFLDNEKIEVKPSTSVNDEYHSQWEFYFKIKPEYTHFFQKGKYFPEDYMI